MVDRVDFLCDFLPPPNMHRNIQGDLKIPDHHNNNQQFNSLITNQMLQNSSPGSLVGGKMSDQNRKKYSRNIFFSKVTKKLENDQNTLKFDDQQYRKFNSTRYSNRFLPIPPKNQQRAQWSTGENETKIMKPCENQGIRRNEGKKRWLIA